jgi:cation diffusion facilitator CzcD-associated flavoprotein CzcO
MAQAETTVDVLIVGAGLSGIGAAAHLTIQCPTKSYAIVEQRADMGGTWDLFRYPGIRFDTDVFTMGYKFKPWRNAKSLADGPDVKSYISDTAAQYGIIPHIRFGHRVLSAEWSSTDACWTVRVQRASDGGIVVLKANFLYMAAGYYDYEAGYRPEFSGEADFTGQIVHPQHWPEDMDYSGKTVVIIGSGATAITLVPAMAETAKKVTMLQRTPTYLYPVLQTSPLDTWLKKFMPASAAYAITRRWNIGMQRFAFRMSRRNPERMKQRLLKWTRDKLPADYPTFEKDFVPPYKPWEQRACAVPEDDVYKAIASGKAEIATDHIDHFTPTGIMLKSGRELAADIIVTATGLNLVTLGKMAMSVDGEPTRMSEHYYYKGAMFSDIPNMVSIFGYVNASWTLKSDIVADYVCRLLKVMDAKGAKIANPKLGKTDMPRLPFVGEFSSGYLARAADNLPVNGDRHPWRVLQHYLAEKKILTKEPVDDGVMVFSGPVAAAIAEPVEALIAAE